MLEMTIFMKYLIILLIGFVLSTIYKSSRSTPLPKSANNNNINNNINNNNNFTNFQRKFLFVYLVMMSADWLQGPYVYRLYNYYGYNRYENGILFIAGFGSSLIFGTWAGPFADKYGRKLNCIIYAITYILSCLTKFFPNFYILMLGRLLGGIATSILWSAFESWMVSEHNSHNYDNNLISGTFSLMVVLNGIIAIISGFLAQAVADYYSHPVAPFGLSIIFLLLGGIFILSQWSENYGSRTGSVVTSMRESINIIINDKVILLVGLQQALFEGAMYTFVFMWTPALEPINNTEEIPHGIVFASFMMACSLGSNIYTLAEQRCSSLPLLMTIIYACAAACLSIPIITRSTEIRMAAFILFEVCVGMFWPGIGTLRSRHLPETHRATIINIFRIPLNIMVCIVLVLQGSMSVRDVFVICSGFNIIATGVGYMLNKGYIYIHQEVRSKDDII